MNFTIESSIIGTKEEIQMNVNSIEPCDCYSGIDEMINEGLGGGFISNDYDAKKLEIRNINPKKTKFRKHKKRRKC